MRIHFGKAMLICIAALISASCSDDKEEPQGPDNPGQQPVGNEWIDPKFAEALQTAGIVEDPASITPEDIDKLTELDISGKELTSLRGLEKFTSLKKLVCSDNKLTTIDISGNTFLTEFRCENNPGENGVFIVKSWFSNRSIPDGFTAAGWEYQTTGKSKESSSFVDIKYIDINNPDDLVGDEWIDPDFAKWLQDHGLITEATTVTPADVAQIVYIDLEYNNTIKSLRGIEYFTNLKALECINTKITNIDVSKNAKLVKLNCYNNEIINLTLGNKPELTKLQCQNNQITTLDVTQCPKLTKLYCGHNQITSLNVTRCPELTELSCTGNQLDKLDLRYCESLNELNCVGNRMPSLDIRYNRKLKSCHFDSNPVLIEKDSKTAEYPVIAWFDEQANPIIYHTKEWKLKRKHSLDEYTVTVKYINADKNQMTEPSDWIDNMFALWLQKCGYISDALNVTPDDVRYLQTVDFSNHNFIGFNNDYYDYDYNIKITSLHGIEYFSSLQYLDCNGHNITGIVDLSKNTKLTYVNLNSNNITGINTNSSPDLETLKCEFNQLTGLDIRNNRKLSTCLFKGNPGRNDLFNVTCWFDKYNVPSDLNMTRESWYLDDKLVRINIIKAK